MSYILSGLGLNQKKFDQLMASFGNIQYLEKHAETLYDTRSRQKRMVRRAGYGGDHGEMDTKTFRSFLAAKLGVNRDHFSTLEMDTGSAYEHRILEHIGIRKMDRQIRSGGFGFG